MIVMVGLRARAASGIMSSRWDLVDIYIYMYICIYIYTHIYIYIHRSFSTLLPPTENSEKVNSEMNIRSADCMFSEFTSGAEGH